MSSSEARRIHIEAWQTSGMTRAAYCREHGLNAKTFGLYKTEGGKLICERIGRTCWQGERESHHAKVCTDHAGVFEFFGYSWLHRQYFCPPLFTFQI